MIKLEMKILDLLIGDAPDKVTVAQRLECVKKVMDIIISVYGQEEDEE